MPLDDIQQHQRVRSVSRLGQDVTGNRAGLQSMLLQGVLQRTANQLALQGGLRGGRWRCRWSG